MQTTAMRRQRTATAQRWHAALARAVAEGVQVRQLAGSGAWVATSGTDAATAYVVDLRACDCRAGQEGDPVCKHRAALAFRLGVLYPAPPPPAAPVAALPRPRACPSCAGDGFVIRPNTINPAYPFRATCRACHGSGQPGKEADALAA